MKTRKPGSGGHNKKPVIHNGKRYPTIKDLALSFGIDDPSLVRYYIKNDKPFQGHFIDYAFK